MSEEKTLKRAFGDIVKGYSKCYIFDQVAYIIHLGHFTQLEIDSVYDKYFEKALKAKVATEKEAIKMAVAQGLWNSSKDLAIQECQAKIDFAIHSKKAQKLPSQIKKYNKEIEDHQKDQNILLNEKAQVMGITAELYAEQKTNHHYMFSSFFKDQKLSERLFNSEEFDYLSDSDLMDMIGTYNKELSPCGLDNIKKIALKPFFQNYFYICSSLIDFYGKPAVDLTYNQVSLANYGRYFKGILENHDKIPDKVKESPDELIDYVTAKQNDSSTKERNTAANKADDTTSAFASMPVGATKEDIETLGYNKENSVNLRDVTRKKGKKSLNMNDLLAVSKT